MCSALSAAIIHKFWVLEAQWFEIYCWPPTWFEKNNDLKLFMNKTVGRQLILKNNRCKFWHEYVTLYTSFPFSLAKTYWFRTRNKGRSPVADRQKWVSDRPYFILGGHFDRPFFFLTTWNDSCSDIQIRIVSIDTFKLPANYKIYSTTTSISTIRDFCLSLHLNFDDRLR